MIAKLSPKLIEFTEELWAAIDLARGDTPRQAWLEERLWKIRDVRDAAEKKGIQRPERPVRGKYTRK